MFKTDTEPTLISFLLNKIKSLIPKREKYIFKNGKKLIYPAKNAGNVLQGISISVLCH